MFASRQRFVQGGQRSNRILSALGTAKISTAQSKFGGTSLLVGPGVASQATDYCNQASASQTTFGTGDFTIECWFRTTAKTNEFPTMISNCPSASPLFTSGANVWELMDRHNSYPTKLAFWTTAYFFSGGNDAILVSATSISNGVWNHVAITRNGNLWTMWLNGASEATRTSSTTLDGGTARALGIGKGDSAKQTNYDGYIDEVRLSNICRYTTAFTPNANGPFINDPNTVLLFHCDGPNNSTVFLDDNT